MRVADAGLAPRTASGPAMNMDDPDAYWDAILGEDGRPAPPATSYEAVKYVEARAAGSGGGPALLSELADLNADVRGASEDYRDPAAAIQQDKIAGARLPADGWLACVCVCVEGINQHVLPRQAALPWRPAVLRGLQ